jgi:hypothetical protein
LDCPDRSEKRQSGVEYLTNSYTIWDDPLSGTINRIGDHLNDFYNSCLISSTQGRETFAVTGISKSTAIKGLYKYEEEYLISDINHQRLDIKGKIGDQNWNLQLEKFGLNASEPNRWRLN